MYSFLPFCKLIENKITKTDQINTSNKIPGRWAGSFVQHFNFQNKYVCMLCRGTNMGVVFSKEKFWSEKVKRIIFFGGGVFGVVTMSK